MAICPDHGGYTGDTCKKCQTPVPLDPEREKAIAGVVKALGGELPSLDPADRLTLVKLENDSLKSFHRMQNAQAQFQNFAQMMFKKYGVGQEYTLDMEKLEFVLKGM